MYRFLTDKLQSTKGVHISSLVMIALEVCNEQTSELIEDFQSEDYDKICKTLDWKEEQSVYELIEEELNNGNNIVPFMFRCGRQGFLAELRIEIPTLFSKKTKKRIYSYSEGYSRIEYLYADTIAQLVDKAVVLGDEINKEEIAKIEQDLKTK